MTTGLPCRPPAIPEQEAGASAPWEGIYDRRKLAQAKTPEEARRSLKRHLSNVVYSHLVTDHRHRTRAC